MKIQVAWHLQRSVLAGQKEDSGIASFEGEEESMSTAQGQFGACTAVLQFLRSEIIGAWASQAMPRKFKTLPMLAHCFKHSEKTIVYTNASGSKILTSATLSRLKWHPLKLYRLYFLLYYNLQNQEFWIFGCTIIQLHTVWYINKFFSWSD